MSDTNQHDEAAGESMSASLDITGEAMNELANEAVALVADYFANISKLPVFPETSASELAGRFGAPLAPEGESLARLLDDCRAIINASRHNGHPRFFGYVASPSTPAGAFADLIASAINQNVTSWRSAPAATEIEKTVIHWLASLIGYNEPAHGLLTSGGSMANLNALHIAHRAKSQQAADVSQKGLWTAGEPATVYVSDQAHLSITKAADVLGIGRDQVRIVESDARFKLDVRKLRARVEADARAGLRPFCVVASAGTVNTGAVDPLMEVARVAEEYNLWFHVDGAFGAPGALAPAKRALFEGIERADSISLDPHKWLYAPIDCGCLLFRDPVAVRAAFQSTNEADYIKISEEADDESFAFWDYGIELSRRFRALKIWMMLRYYGSRRVAAAIAKDNALAEYLADRIVEAEDFELLAPVELSICCFRYVPPDMRAKLSSANEAERAVINTELNQLNARIMHAVQRGGRAYLSNASLRGRYALRACITNFRATRTDIAALLDIIREANINMPRAV